MNGLRLAAVLAGAASLGACADYLAVDSAGNHTAAAPRPVMAETTTAAPAPVPVAAKPDTCGAAALQYLVGKPKSEVPVPVNPAGRRVYCSTCMVTMDYSPARLNIVFDQDSGIVKAVKCG